MAVTLVLLPTGGAKAAPSDPAPSKEIVAAMVEQFGLTPSEARERIRAEGKASDLRDAARQAAGDASAGAFFDPASLRLLVRVTDPAVFDAVWATGAEPQLTSTSFADLEQDLHVLDSRTDTKPPESRWLAHRRAGQCRRGQRGGRSHQGRADVRGRA